VDYINESQQIKLIKQKFRNLLILMNDAIKRHDFKSRKRIIILHEILDRHLFKQKMLWLKENFDILPLHNLFYTSTYNKTAVAITFDDGYSCWYYNAVPVLEELRLSATFFVCSGFVGLNKKQANKFIENNFRKNNNKLYLKPLSKEQLLDISNNPLFEIGSHTINHVDLGQNMEIQTLKHEILGDCDTLQKWTGRKVKWFAYPFGRIKNVSKVALRFLENTSLSGSFTAIPKDLSTITDNHLLGRDYLDLLHSTSIWKAQLNGAYDVLYDFKERLYLLHTYYFKL